MWSQRIEQNPANDPEFIHRVADRIERDQNYAAAVYGLWMQGNLSWLWHDAQRDIAQVCAQDKDEILVFCSRQLGKSFYILTYVLSHLICFPRRTVARVFSSTIEQVNEIVADNLALIESVAPPGFIERKKSDRRWIVGPKQAELRLGPLDKAHVDGKRGGNASLIVLEESGFVRSDDLVYAIGSVINPQLLRSGGKLIHVTTPPEDIGHYVVTNVLPKCRLSGAVAEYDIYKNPQLTPAQIEKARSRCTSEDEWKREYLVQIVRSEKRTVIPEYDDARHVHEMPIPEYTFFRTAMDFGGVRDLHAALLTFWDFERAVLCVLDERIWPINTPSRVIRQDTEEMESQVTHHESDPNPVRISDAPGQLLVDLRAEGFLVRLPEKVQGSWEAGINAVRGGFSKNQIEIHPRCKNLRAALQYGLYNKNRTDFERTETLGHLDALSALIYGWRHKDTRNPLPLLPKSAHRDTHFISEDKTDRHRVAQNAAALFRGV